MEIGQELPDVTNSILKARLKRGLRNGIASIDPDTGKPSIGEKVATTVRAFIDNIRPGSQKRPGRR